MCDYPSDLRVDLSVQLKPDLHSFLAITRAQRDQTEAMPEISASSSPSANCHPPTDILYTPQYKKEYSSRGFMTQTHLGETERRGQAERGEFQRLV